MQIRILSHIQARRQSSVTGGGGGHKHFFWGGTKTFFPRIQEWRPKKKGFHREICPKIHEFWDEDQNIKKLKKIKKNVFIAKYANSGVKTNKRVFIAKSAKKRFLPTITELMTSIWESQAPNCTSVAPSQLLSLRHNFRLEGYISRLGGQGVIWEGTTPKCPPPVAPGLHILKKNYW